MKIRDIDKENKKESIPADASIFEAVQKIKRQAKKFKFPDTTKMWGFKIIKNPATWYFFKTELKRDEKIKKFPGAKKINPRKI